MTKDEALKLALEELADRFSEGWHEGIKIDASDIMLLSKAAQALAQEQCKYPDCKCPTENPCLKGLAQPEQEPVRIMGFDCVCGRRMVVNAEQGVVPAPQRTWQGLTDKEIEQIVVGAKVGEHGIGHTIARAIEAKLKEKNGYAEEKNT